MSAVIVIDVQNCFLPGGSLATVNTRNTADKPASALAEGIVKFIADKPDATVFVTKDWHTPGHSSFARENKGEVPIVARPELEGTRVRPEEYKDRPFNPEGKRFWGDDQSRLAQALWPEHCVQGTDGAKIAPELEAGLAGRAIETVLKGDEPTVDSYSAIANALGYPTPHMEDGKTFLTRLQEGGFTDLYITGIARDVCVFWSALDLLNYLSLPAKAAGRPCVKIHFVYDLTRPVYGAAPAFNKTKEEIESAVRDLITKMGLGAEVYDECFVIEDSGMYGGRRRHSTRHRSRSAHHKRSTKRSTKRCRCGKLRGHKGSRNCQ